MSAHSILSFTSVWVSEGAREGVLDPEPFVFVLELRVETLAEGVDDDLAGGLLGGSSSFSGWSSFFPLSLDSLHLESFFVGMMTGIGMGMGIGIGKGIGHADSRKYPGNGTYTRVGMGTGT